MEGKDFLFGEIFLKFPATKLFICQSIPKSTPISYLHDLFCDKIPAEDSGENAFIAAKIESDH
jgi:hypothetical protein